MYIPLLTTHVTCAILSISLFITRGGLKLAQGDVPDRFVFKVVPHVIDTVLLLSAIGLTVVIGQYPFVNSWLTVKLFALIAYIILGSVALKRARGRPATTISLVAATLLFGYIVSVAWYHDPLGILG